MSRSDMLRLLLFFECNLFSIEAVDIFSRVPAFQPRIQIISLYDDKNVRQFISHMSLKWQMKVPEKIQEDIIRQCGGMLLLVKEALWYLRDHPKGEALQIFNHPEMRFNLASLWQGFGEDERMVLQSLTKGDAFDKLKFKSNIDYLRLVGILENHGHTYRITIPLLSNYIKESFLTAKQLTTDDGGKIYLDGIVVSTHFSRKERRVLSFLIKQVNTLVTREQLSNELWPTDLEKNYSDWAIDSHISRLRKRLVNLGLDRGILKTRKGRGFILRRNGEYD